MRVSLTNVKWPCNGLKVSGPKFSTRLEWTPKCEWYMVRCGSKNGNQKGIMCLKVLHYVLTIC